MNLISWEHPMIQGGIDLVLTEGVGATAVSLLKNKALPAGTLLLELIYVVDAQAPKKSGIGRFLPKTPIRLMMDSKGNDLSAQVEFESFNRQLSPVNRHMASKLVNSVQKEIHALIDTAEVSIEDRIEAVRVDANAEMKTALNAELDRLQALKAVNPNIRDEELTQIETQMSELSAYIGKAQVQLDSLRLIVVSHN
jgi:ATP-dependent helicase HepA